MHPASGLRPTAYVTGSGVIRELEWGGIDEWSARADQEPTVLIPCTKRRLGCLNVALRPTC